ncbi:MAG: (d)CMP kinase, partial [Thermodesulfobacteriota bacterium]|nr:(d)CMP kinase [Thermodesulfobacteriota bacterium]
MESGRRIITIDGPAGAGKSTVARALANRLGWTYLDTGAMYRAVGLAAFEDGADVSDEKAMTRLMAGLDLKVAASPETTRVYLAGREVTSEIRQPHISGLASAASALGVVRRAMVDLQRRLGAAGEIVAEGRDMGTVVFPRAEIKFFIDASLEERARRRFEELQASDKALSLVQVTRD